MKEPTCLREYKRYAKAPRHWRGEAPLLFAYNEQYERVRVNGMKGVLFACTFDLTSAGRVEFYAKQWELRNFSEVA